VRTLTTYDAAGTGVLETDAQYDDGRRTITAFPTSGPYAAIRQEYDAGGAIRDLDAVLRDGSYLLRGFQAGVTLTAHAGARDVIAFRVGDGNQTVQGFVAGTDAAHDVLEVPHGFFANDDYAAGLSTVNGSAVLTGTSGETLTLTGVAPGQLAAADFSFV
jgi:hypothetical protein